MLPAHTTGLTVLAVSLLPVHGWNASVLWHRLNACGCHNMHSLVSHTHPLPHPLPLRKVMHVVVGVRL